MRFTFGNRAVEMEFGFEWMDYSTSYIRMSIFSDEPVRHK